MKLLPMKPQPPVTMSGGMRILAQSDESWEPEDTPRKSKLSSLSLSPAVPAHASNRQEADDTGLDQQPLPTTLAQGRSKRRRRHRRPSVGRAVFEHRKYCVGQGRGDENRLVTFNSA